MKPVRLLVAAAASLAMLLVAVMVPIRAQTLWTVVMSGLDNPRGLTFVLMSEDDGPTPAAADGDVSGFALYVAEAGKGGSGPCAMIRGAVQCAGTSGAVSRYHRGQQERVVTGLPSYAPSSGAGATGPHDVSFDENAGYVTIGLGGPQSPVVMRSLVGPQFGWIVRFDHDGNWTFDTDVASYEQQVNPGGGPQDSNPYGLLKKAGKRIVVDAGANAMLRIAQRPPISTIAIFPSRAQGRPTDSVPNSAVRGPDGAFYVGELTGVPFVPETANLWRVVPGHAPQVRCSGFNFIIDLDFDEAGHLFVLEHTSAPFPAGAGTLYRVAPDCTRTPVITGLSNPTSVAIGPDGDAYISNFGTSAAAGEVIRVDPGTVPAE